MSELARFSHTLEHVHRYKDQTCSTIYNSVSSLEKIVLLFNKLFIL